MSEDPPSFLSWMKVAQSVSSIRETFKTPHIWQPDQNSLYYPNLMEKYFLDQLDHQCFIAFDYLFPNENNPFTVNPRKFDNSVQHHDFSNLDSDDEFIRVAEPFDEFESSSSFDDDDIGRDEEGDSMELAQWRHMYQLT